MAIDPLTTTKRTRYYLTTDKECWIDVWRLPSTVREKTTGSSRLFKKLWNSHPDTFEKIKIINKWIPVPRYQRSYLRDYRFSGSIHRGYDPPKCFTPYFKWATKESNQNRYGLSNQYVVNWYENGNNYIGAHSDDEKDIVKDSPIIGLSLGGEHPTNLRATRLFRLKQKTRVQLPQGVLLGKEFAQLRGGKNFALDVILRHGTIFVMGGKTQTYFTHEIPKIGGKIGAETPQRISFTFRQFIPV